MLRESMAETEQPCLAARAGAVADVAAAFIDKLEETA
jgi:hypothetical protein